MIDMKAQISDLTAKLLDLFEKVLEDNICVIQETLKSTEAREVILQDKVRDLKNKNRTAGADNVKRLQGQVQCLIKQRASQAEAFMAGSQKIMDQSKRIVELEKAKGFSYGGVCLHKFDDPKAVDQVASPINGEEVTVESLQARLEKVEKHNDSLKAKVRRVIEEQSNLEDALLKVARGY